MKFKKGNKTRETVSVNMSKFMLLKLSVSKIEKGRIVHMVYSFYSFINL